MNFEEIPGFAKLKKKLIYSVIHQQIPQCLLFYSENSSLATQIAFAYSKLLLCYNSNKGLPCECCKSCLTIANGSNPDFLLLYPKPANLSKYINNNDFLEFIKKQKADINNWKKLICSNKSQFSIKKEDVQYIIEETHFSTFFNKKKIVYCWLPEFMHSAAYSALLKTIEEPSPNLYFIFVSHEKQKLSPTIISRMQCIFIHSNSIFPDIEINEEKKLNNLFKNWIRICYKKDYKELLNLSKELSQLHNKELVNFINHAIKNFRLLYLKKAKFYILNKDNDIEQFLEKINDFLTLKEIIQIIEKLNNAQSLIEKNINPKILIFIISCNFNFKKQIHNYKSS